MALSTLAWPASAQDNSAPLPPAADLLAKHLAAIGGRAAVDKFGSMTMTGALRGGGVPVGASFIRYADSQGRMVHELVVPDKPTEREGWNGHMAFRSTSGTDTPVTGTTAEGLRTRGEAFLGVHDVDVQKTAVTTERSDFMGCICYKVRLTLSFGATRFDYYDAKTGLLTGWIQPMPSLKDKPLERLVILRKYKAFGGVQVPTDIYDSEYDVDRRMLVADVKWNVPVPAAMKVTP